MPLTSEEMANDMACFERPPKAYGKGDLPWVSRLRFIILQFLSHETFVTDTRGEHRPERRLTLLHANIRSHIDPAHTTENPQHRPIRPIHHETGSKYNP